VLVQPGAEVPAPWAACERVPLDAGALADPGVLDRVRRAFLTRERLVFEVSAVAPAPGTASIDLWRVPVDHDFVAESLWTLATANAVDARGPGGPVWAPALAAEALGATSGADRDVDLVLADGRTAWCDGGPLRLWLDGEVPGGAMVIPRLNLEHDRLEPLATTAPDAELAPDQLEAVADAGARARIIAPAGSGKTRVLTERARHLLRSGVPDASLLLVAFNKRAQLEMQERTADLPRLQVQTLNALALAILNGTQGFASRPTRVTTIDELQVRRMLSDMVKFPRRANTDPAAAWLDALSAVRLGLRDPAEVEREYNGDVDGLGELFPDYRRALRKAGAVDFDEQVYLAIEVLLTEPDVRLQAQRRAQVLLVDEFQDLTPAHMLLLRLLAGPELGIFGVGDDDQTIYGYSGASPDWLVNFDDYVPAATHHALEVNYRCPAPVITAATNLLSRNAFRVAKTVHAGPGNVRDGDSRQVVEHELPVLAALDLVRAHLDAGAAPSDIAVLTRVNTLLAPVQAILRSEGIPVQNRDGLRFLERAGVAAALSWLRLAVQPTRLSGEDIQRAARRPSRGLSPRVVEWMGDQRDVAALDRLAGRVTDQRSAEKIVAFARDIERISRLATTSPTARLIEFVRTEIGLDTAMQTLDAAHRGRNTAAHSDDLRALIALGRLHPEPKTFFAWLDDALRPSNADDGVLLSTVHKVKGLEWPHVIVYDATQGVFPHRLSTDIEEERRVFHVAITRAQRSLHIVADSANRSLFLDELLTEGAPAPLTGLITSGSAPSHAASATARSPRAVPEAAAAVGLALSWGGYECEVVSIETDGVTLAAGRAQLTVAFGSQVTIDGRPRVLVAPKATAGGRRGAKAGVEHDNPAVLAALKAWRSARAKTDAVPAYVVANDKTLDEIASLLPTNAAELLQVSGIGPTKVDRYGDEILAVLEEAASAS
jgi:DNA helicase-2/ATP-dependent DNA helicase PcrA